MNDLLQKITSILINGSKNKKLPKGHVDLLLGAVAISALSNQALAESKVLDKSDLTSKGYIIDVAQIVKESGVESVDINTISFKLSSDSSGLLIDIGEGLFKYIPSDLSNKEISFVISAKGIDTVVTTVLFAESQLIDFSAINLNSILNDEFILSHQPKLLKHIEYTKPAEELSIRESFAKSWNDFIDELNSDESVQHSKIDVNFDMSALGLGILALAGGGSSGSSGSSGEDLNGVASHGTLENARVFLDLDGDTTSDANEIF
jgi:hypothetical protein